MHRLCTDIHNVHRRVFQHPPTSAWEFHSNGKANVPSKAEGAVIQWIVAHISVVPSSLRMGYQLLSRSGY